jgi:hypothetical protein
MPHRKDEDVIRRVLAWRDPTACPLPGHHRNADPRSFNGKLAVCRDCLGEAAWWDHSGWHPDIAYGLADAFYAVRSGELLERGFGQSRGYRFVWRLLLAHEAPAAQASPR